MGGEGGGIEKNAAPSSERESIEKLLLFLSHLVSGHFLESLLD